MKRATRWALANSPGETPRTRRNPRRMVRRPTPVALARSARRVRSVGVFGEVLGGGGDDGGLGVGARSCEVRLAALAGAIAGLFGCSGGGEEGDVLARGAAAGAAWAAVDLGRFDGVEELAVGAGVAREHLLPLAAGEEAGHGDWRRGA